MSIASKARDLHRAIRVLKKCRVVVSDSDMLQSQFLSSPENALIYLSREDMIDGLQGLLASEPVVITPGTGTIQIGPVVIGPGGGTLLFPKPPTPGTPPTVPPPWYRPPISIRVPIPGGGGGWILLGMPAISLNCRAKAGTATMCGWNEYVPSIPPRKYLTRTLSGNAVGEIYTDSNCTVPDCTGTDAFSGDCSYDAATCTLTSNGQRVRTVTGPDCGTNGSFAQCDIGSPSLGDYVLLTPTSRQMGNDGLCHFNPGPNNWFHRGSNTRKEKLTAEDTEDAAVARAKAGLSWNSSTCSTYRTIRGPGSFSVNFSDAQCAATVGGCSVGQSYVITFNMQTRPTGSAQPFVDAYSIDVGFTATTTSETTPYQDITTAYGYETQVSTVTVALA